MGALRADKKAMQQLAQSSMPKRINAKSMFPGFSRLWHQISETPVRRISSDTYPNHHQTTMMASSLQVHKTSALGGVNH